MSRIHFLQHVAFEGPGSIANWAKTGDIPYRSPTYTGEKPPRR
ncbi:MAG: amidotransferase, partial [Desulfobacterales bacterium]|nr:amidotransferase [Desulfobacterales bacterium]